MIVKVKDNKKKYNGYYENKRRTPGEVFPIPDTKLNKEELDQLKKTSDKNPKEFKYNHGATYEEVIKMPRDFSFKWMEVHKKGSAPEPSEPPKNDAGSPAEEEVL